MIVAIAAAEVSTRGRSTRHIVAAAVIVMLLVNVGLVNRYMADVIRFPADAVIHDRHGRIAYELRGFTGRPK